MPQKKLLAFREHNSQPFKIRAGVDETKAEIILYTAIGDLWWQDSTSASDFDAELKKLSNKVTEITVRINSPGGDVFDGYTIYNRLKQHKAKVIVYIDGLAASIASIIALAGDEVIIGEGALFMIHLPWTWAMGNRMDLENAANRLIDIEDQLVGTYFRASQKNGETKLSKEEIRALLEAETWMSADDAIKYGFVNKKAEEALPIAASAMDARWIRKAPKGFNSEAKAVDKIKNGLKQKIQETLARK